MHRTRLSPRGEGLCQEGSNGNFYPRKSMLRFICHASTALSAAPRTNLPAGIPILYRQRQVGALTVAIVFSVAGDFRSPDMVQLFLDLDRHLSYCDLPAGCACHYTDGAMLVHADEHLMRPLRTLSCMRLAQRSACLRIIPLSYSVQRIFAGW